MTANDMYQLFVGEIGIPRREFLYEICFWEARRIFRGYRNRYRDMYLHKNGIFSPTDLIKFPWDKSESEKDLPSDEWVNEARKKLQMLNEKKGVD